MNGIIRAVTALFVAFASTVSVFAGREAGTMFCREISIPEGLSSDKVTALVKDEMGRLWIGTHKGVNCFDSQTTIVLPFFRNSRITSIFRLPGRMVVCSLYGMAVYDLNTGQWHGITADGKEIPGVISGFTDGNELIFVAGDSICSFEDGKPVKIITNTRGAVHISKDRYGDVWESSQHEIYRIDKVSGSVFKYQLPDIAPNQSIAGLYCESTGAIWVWSSSGDLYRYSRTGDGFVKEELLDVEGRRIVTDNISCIQEYSKGQLLIGYHDGVVKFDPGDKVASRIEYNNPSFDRLHTVTALECSEAGDIFAGSFFNGVFIMSPAAYDVHLIPLNRASADGKSTSTVANNIYEKEDGSLLVGTNNNSLVCIGRDGEYVNSYGDGRRALPADVLTVVSDARGDIYAGLQYSGLWRIDRTGNASEIVPQTGRFSGACLSDLFPADEDHLYVATENGIDLLRLSTKEVRPLLAAKGNCQYFGAFQVGEKVLFVNHNSLMVIGRNGSDPKEIPFESPSGATIRSGCGGPDDNLLLGTDNGEIVSFDLAAGSFNVLNDEAFRYSEISNLILDASGRMWATSGNRMCVFDAAGQCLQEYGLANLMGRRLFNIRSSLLCRNGDIVFGTTDGIVRCSPQKLEEASQYPKSIHITQISADGIELSMLLDKGEARLTRDGVFVLPHNRSIVTIACSVIDYSPFNNGAHNVKVRVSPVGKGWESVPKNLTFKSTSLPPGKYVAEWQLLSANGELLSTDSIRFRIKPHKLVSAGMIVLYIILGTILSYLGSLYYKRVKQRKEEQFREEESRRINDLFNTRRMELLVNMGNEFKAPISIVSSALSSNDVTSTDLVRNNVTKMRFLVDQMLDLEKFGLTSGQGGAAKLYDYSKFVSCVCDKLIPQLDKNRIHLILEGGGKEMPALFEAGKMELILCNMLKHLSKVAQAGSSATLTLKNEGDRITMRLKCKMNQGIDSGGEIGLHIANCICDLSGYSLEETVENGGETLCNILTIPAGEKGPMASLEDYDFEITDRIADSVADAGISPTEFRDSEGHRKYSLLVVDNSEDHVKLIKRNLKQDMHVRSARSGEEALTAMASGTFDIVLSEIDLPDMSGYDLCRAIKSNEEGHTAPVILMNYGMTEKKRLMALAANADQTIEKPVSLPSLFLMIRNLLKSDEEMRSRLMEVRGLGLPSQKMNRSDDRFVEKSIAYIKDNLSSNISIGALSEALGVSRTRLYDDFNRITGMTPGDFVLKIKLQEACSLLESTNLTASEISYKLGYCNPNHFTRQFKSVYGKTPIAWRKEKS